jgi:ribosomal protein L27
MRSLKAAVDVDEEPHRLSAGVLFERHANLGNSLWNETGTQIVGCGAEGIGGDYEIYMRDAGAIEHERSGGGVEEARNRGSSAESGLLSLFRHLHCKVSESVNDIDEKRPRCGPG